MAIGPHRADRRGMTMKAITLQNWKPAFGMLSATLVLAFLEFVRELGG